MKDQPSRKKCASRMWVFGYGSLIWRPGFPHLRSKICYCRGYRRVWHQGSTDHRGTPEKPGRTVTLEKAADSVVWGRAFEVSQADWEDVVYSYLLEREKQYDLECLLRLYEVCDETGEEKVSEIATRHEEWRLALEGLTLCVIRLHAPN